MTDIAELASWSALWEAVDIFGVALVLIGVIGEGVSEWHPKGFDPWPHFKKLGRISWLLLVAGLAVELVAQHKKDAGDALIIAMLNDRATSATARAEEAKLALEKLKTPRTLGSDRQKFIAESTAPFKGQRYETNISSGADDGLAFWESLYSTLQSAGWVYVPPEGPPTVGNPPAGIPFAAIPGVEILFEPTEERELSPAAIALGNALHADGMVVAVNRNNPNGQHKGVLVIRIGARVPPP